MRTAQRLPWIVVVMLFACLGDWGNAQEHHDSPAIVAHFSADEMSRLSSGVAFSIEWYHYWFGDWQNDPHFALSSVALHGVPFPHQGSESVFVAIEELRSVVACAPDGSRFSCIPYSSDSSEEEYASTKQRLGADQQSQRVLIKLDDHARSMVHFGAFGVAKIRKLDGIFRDPKFMEAFSGLRPWLRAPGSIRFRIGNYSPDAEWIYFYMEGEPHFCTIRLDESRTKFADLDCLNLSILAHSRDYRFAEKRINRNGARFVLRNGHLVPAGG